MTPRLGALLLLLACTGCDRLWYQAPRRIYAPWEEGLTLSYEDPSLPAAQRLAQRQQVRVKESRPVLGGLAITKTYTTLAGQWEGKVLEQEGGVQIQTGFGSIQLLPEGFPDRVGRWVARGTFNRVVGRAVADLPGVLLPDPARAVGVWVETTPLDRPGQRIRTFYLPDIGEAQTLTWRDGRWVTINLLVARGFTDVPRAGGKTPGSPP